MSDWQEMLSADVLTLGMAADEVRRGALSRVVTYLRVHEVTLDTVGSLGTSSVPTAAGELRLYAAPASFDDALTAVAAMREAAGGRRVSAFSWADLAERGWTGAAELRALVDAGLQDVAEMPVDRVEDLCGAVAALTAAGNSPVRLTVSHPLGSDRVDVLRRVVQAFAAAPSLRRFSPLPRVAPVEKPTTGYDDVRMVALSRLALGNRSIEVDWSLYGPKLAQVALTFGADHLDAVSAVDDTALGRRRTTMEDVERNIRAAGFEPQEYRPA